MNSSVWRQEKPKEKPTKTIKRTPNQFVSDKNRTHLSTVAIKSEKFRQFDAQKFKPPMAESEISTDPWENSYFKSRNWKLDLRKQVSMDEMSDDDYAAYINSIQPIY